MKEYRAVSEGIQMMEYGIQGGIRKNTNDLEIFDSEDST